MIGVRTTVSARPGSWRDRYPVLLDCMIDGRWPTAGEIETLTARILRDFGREQPGSSGAIPRGSRLWERARATAQIALEGEPGRDRDHSTFPLVARGH